MSFTEKIAEYRKVLKQYKKRLQGKEEVVKRFKQDAFGILDPVEKSGFVVNVYGKEVFIERPQEPNPVAYYYHRYFRAGDTPIHASARGLLTEGLYNRDIRHERVEAYAEDMQAGHWQSLLSDPISVTSDGQIVNGQHRIAAAERVDWSKVENDPLFLVVWEVDPGEARYADGSRRTDRDQRVIRDKLAAVPGKESAARWPPRDRPSPAPSLTRH